MQRNRKTIEWERLEISSRELDIPREHFMQRWAIKDRNGVDLTETKDIKKHWQEYTEELYKKDLHHPDSHDGVITHLEPVILECEIKWALGSITKNKASGSDGIPVELFQVLNDDALKMLHSIFQRIWKLYSGQGLEKVSFNSSPKERQCQRMLKLPKIALITHTSKIMLKIL